jgi:hypothetical protein
LTTKDQGTSSPNPDTTNNNNQPINHHHHRNVQEAVVAEAMDVLSQELLIYRYTIAFPEYAFPIQERLKRFAKQCRPQRWRALAKGLVDEAEKRAAFVEKERARRELAPTDAVPFEGLKPPGEPAAGARLKAFLDAKAQRAGLAVARAAAARRNGGGGGDDSEEEEEEDSEEEEEEQRRRQQQQQQQKAVQQAQKGKGKQGQKGQQGLEAAESVERLEDEVGELGEWSSSEGGEDGDGMDFDEDEEDEEEESE